MLIILAVAVNATVLVPHESATVSHIVGNTPEEMRQKLMDQNKDINTYNYISLQNDQSHTADILDQAPGYDPFRNHWTYLVQDMQNWNPEAMLLIHTAGQISGNKPVATALDPADTDQWDSAFQQNKPIVAFDADFAGIHLPNIDSFIKRRGKDAVFIAPTGTRDEFFLETLLCNLDQNNQISDLFRQTRNNYYWGQPSPSGLTLMGYQLHGNPFTTYTANGLNQAAISQYCQNLQATFSTTSFGGGYTIASTGPGTYTRSREFDLTYTVENISDHNILNVDGFNQHIELGNPILPEQLGIEQFASQTIVRNFSYELSNPVTIDLGAIPVWTGELNASTCENSMVEAHIDFTHTYGTEETVIADIQPAEIIDCQAGTVRLYTHISYDIRYTPHSPIFIEDIEVSHEVIPETTENVEVHIQNLETSPASGLLVLKKGNEIKVSMPINTTSSQYTLMLETPAEEGQHDYRVEFVQQNDSKTYRDFSIDVKSIDASLDIPTINYENTTIDVTIINNLQNSLPATIKYYLRNETGTINTTLQPGMNTVPLTFTNLDRSEEQYHTTVSIAYRGTNQLLAGTIVVNHPPDILNTNIVTEENETINITPLVTDIDGDAIQTHIHNAPFDLHKHLSFEDSGEYTLRIEADDGYTATTHNISLIVENINRPPHIEAVGSSGVEGQTLQVTVNVSDPDNENAVSNDDNNLIITYGSPLDQNGHYDADYDSERTINTWVEVNDGENIVREYVTLTIENMNRPPNIESIQDITIDEGDLINFSATDPDNQNNNSNDDQILTHTFSALIPETGILQTTDEHSGTYNIHATVTDGEVNVSKDITVTINNVNRPPEVTSDFYVYNAGDLVTIVPDIHDPDNENNVSNDDNDITVEYGAPLDAQGQWQTQEGDVGTHRAPVTVSDGQWTITQQAAIIIQEAGSDIPENNTLPANETTPINTSDPINLPTNESNELEPTNETDPTNESTNTTDTRTDPPGQTNETPINDTLDDGATTTPTNETTDLTTLEPADETEPNNQTNITETTPNETATEFDVTVRVNGKTSRTIDIDPGEEIDIEVDINNDDIEREVRINADIRGVGDDEDYLLMNPLEQEDTTLTLDIGRNPDKDEYELEVLVENGQKKYADYYKIKIDKPRYGLHIIDTLAVPPHIPCHGKTTIKFGLENTGTEDQEGRIKLTGTTLLKTLAYDLAQGDAQHYAIELYNLKEGEHTYTIATEDIQETLTVHVEACKREEAHTPLQATQERTEPTSATRVYATPIETKLNIPNLLFLTGLIGGLALIVLIVVAFILKP